jgi:hypothetical protein
MPPSDDLQELIAESAPCTNTLVTTAIALDDNLQNDLSNVFENKMTNNYDSIGISCSHHDGNNIQSTTTTTTTTTQDTEQQPQSRRNIINNNLEKQQQEEQTEEECYPSVEQDSTCSSTSNNEENRVRVVEGERINPTENTNIENDSQQQQQEKQQQMIATTDNETEEEKQIGPKVEVKDGPLALIKKGAVAAVGGTMVGVGLVMIPLPTPFGAVIASSGLAVLGTEFKEAKEMNDRLIEGAKGLVRDGRERIVRSIESMESEDFDADKQDDTTTTAKDPDEEDGDKDDEGAPKWLLMNPIERERQERIAREKYRRENQTTYQQTKEYLTKKTGSFLSRNLLPFLKDTRKDVDEPTNEEVKTGPVVEEKNRTQNSTEKVAAEADEGYVVINQEDSSSSFADCEENKDDGNPEILHD